MTPGVACATHNNCRAFRHQTKLPSTPPWSCLTSPLSMPPTRRWLGLSLSQAVGKRYPTIVEWCHPASSSKAPRRMPRAARRGESNTLNGLHARSTTTTITTRKRMTRCGPLYRRVGSILYCFCYVFKLRMLHDLCPLM
jgi:hypothetical protein